MMMNSGEISLIVSIWYLGGLDVFRYIPTDVMGQHLQGSADVKIETIR